MDDPALLYAPHGEPGRFWNPWAPMTTGFSQLLRWKLRKNPYSPRRPPRVPVVANDGAYLASRAADAEPPSLTWVGQSTYVLQEGGEVFVTDPHWGARALLPRRQSPPGLPLSAIPAHACALLSHNHYDHLDAWTVDRLPPEVRWFVPRGVGRWFRGRKPREVVELDWWESARHGRFTLTCLPAQHWSNRISVKRNATLWCSWLLDSGDRRTYFAGDSGYFHGFAEFGRRFGPIDAALLPIGAYEPRWFMRYQHMDPGEALRAFRDLGARHLFGMHWGTFDLTDEPIDLAPAVLAREVAAAGEDPSRVHALAVGERFPLAAP
ncbi:MAG TPA: MBL fold metallo-hydrolase [Thermoanaerobaculia bacterium]|nr:MBL fold metallo-hydrolase [Thermoanaerobaculia bacterium]